VLYSLSESTSMLAPCRVFVGASTRPPSTTRLRGLPRCPTTPRPEGLQSLAHSEHRRRVQVHAPSWAAAQRYIKATRCTPDVWSSSLSLRQSSPQFASRMRPDSRSAFIRGRSISRCDRSTVSLFGFAQPTRSRLPEYARRGRGRRDEHEDHKPQGGKGQRKWGWRVNQ
jgi:hypothetical protein